MYSFEQCVRVLYCVTKTFPARHDGVPDVSNVSGWWLWHTLSLLNVKQNTVCGAG